MLNRLALETLAALPAEPFLRTECPGLGLSLTGIRSLLETGILRQPLRGVLTPSYLPDSVEARAAAVRLVLPAGAALCRTTSAWLHGVDARPPGAHQGLRPVECTVPLGRTPIKRPGARCFVSDLREDDLTEVAGLPATSPARTAIDLARWSTPGMGLAVLDAMARAALVDPDDLAARLHRWTGARYVARARRLIDLCTPDAESFGESWLRLRFHDAGFPPPELQIPLVDRGGTQIFRLDLGYSRVRHSWEYDGEEHHLGPAAEAADRRRRLEIERRWGWTVIGVGKNLVLGPSMALEQGVAEVIGIAPRIGRRTW